MLELHLLTKCLSCDQMSTERLQNPGGGCTLIFSYIRRLGSLFGFKILNFNILGGFQKN